MSNPIFTHRFPWAENIWMQRLGWPVMVAAFVLLSLRFQDMGPIHYPLASLFTPSSTFPYGVMTLVGPIFFCALFCDADGMGFDSINKGPDWSSPTRWYAASVIALIAWILLTGTFYASMTYWIVGITFGLDAFGIIVNHLILESWIKTKAPPIKRVDLPFPPGGMLLQPDPWADILHNRHADRWLRYIADARAAGREDLAQVLQAMLNQNLSIAEEERSLKTARSLGVSVTVGSCDMRGLERKHKGDSA